MTLDDRLSPPHTTHHTLREQSDHDKWYRKARELPCGERWTELPGQRRMPLHWPTLSEQATVWLESWCQASPAQTNGAMCMCLVSNHHSLFQRKLVDYLTPHTLCNESIFILHKLTGVGSRHKFDSDGLTRHVQYCQGQSLGTYWHANDTNRNSTVSTPMISHNHLSLS